MRKRRASANLRRHAVTEVQNGDVVRVWPLIHTQIWPQAIPQLHKKKKVITRKNDIMDLFRIIHLLMANEHTSAFLHYPQCRLTACSERCSGI